jgi:hypothetical protein
LTALAAVVAPVFKLCFRSSAPFAGVLTWAPPAQPLAADRRDPPMLLSLLLSAALGAGLLQAAEPAQ